MESLYRKYRPLTFDDVIGQRHVVSTLKRAIVENKTSHAYLFCGPRGTGKTTLARILAKALICQKGEHQLPDGTCENCRLIAAGNHPDVYELDAASRTGVDNVREEIISRIDYAPVRGSYKIYIIDEVHMLTPAAFNALLKTLEEPPAHVTFIMCTTDPQKILETILSRVQRFDFHAIDKAEISERLSHICIEEKFSYEDAALDSIARHARGSMRDALSTLEQLSVFCNGTITLEAAHDLLGEVATCELSTLVHAIAEHDVPTLFSEVARHVATGHNLLQLTQSLIHHLRDLYVVSMIGPQKGVITGTAEELAACKAEADTFESPNRIARILTILGETTTTMRTTPNQQLALELALTRIARPESEVTLEALHERIEILERKISSQAFSTPIRTDQESNATSAPHDEVKKSTKIPPTHESTHDHINDKDASLKDDVHEVTSEPPAAAQKFPSQAEESPVQEGLSAQAESSVRERPSAQAESPVQEGLSAQAESPVPKQPVTTTTDAGELQRAWHKVIDKLAQTVPARSSLLAGTTATADDGVRLVITLPAKNAFISHMLEESDMSQSISRAVEQVIGKRSLVYRHDAVTSPAKDTTRQDPAAKAHEVPSVVAPPASPVQEVSKHQKDTAKMPEQSLENQPEQSAVTEPISIDSPDISIDSPDDTSSTSRPTSSAPSPINDTEFDDLARLAEGVFGNTVSISTSQAPDSNNQ